MVLLLQQEGNHCCMVIMDMEKVRDKVNAFHGFKSSQLEEGKAFAIVKITVHMTTEEIILIINEVEGNPIQDSFFNTAPFLSFRVLPLAPGAATT